MKNSNKLLSLILLGFFVGGCATTEPAKEEPAPEPKAAEVKPAPAPEPPAPAPAPAPAVKADDSYNVVRGDHLWGIAGKPAIYGNPYEWPLIFKANRDKIQDADLIHPGQVFTISRSASQADIDAAVRHAKTRGEWKLGVVEESDKAYLAR
jgi:LysM repeat protein